MVKLASSENSNAAIDRNRRAMNPRARSALWPKARITLKDGVVEQRNLDGYLPPYIIDAPVAIDVYIVPSTEAPTGCGEPPVPVISPAVVNALARLTGKRYRYRWSVFRIRIRRL